MTGLDLPSWQNFRKLGRHVHRCLRVTVVVGFLKFKFSFVMESSSDWIVLPAKLAIEY